MADEVGIRRRFVFALFHLLEKGFGARARDGTEILHQIAMVHADAIVLNGQRARPFVDRQRDFEVRIISQQVVLGDGGIAQLVAGVRGVGNQLAQEDIFIFVERVDHEIEQLADLGLELMGL